MRKISFRMIKANKSYSQKELMDELGVDRKTLYNWRKERLIPMQGENAKGRGLLFRGKDIINFLEEQKENRKINVWSKELLCMKCQRGRFSQKDKLVFNSENLWSDDKTSVRVEGVCIICGTKMNKSCNIKAAEELKLFHEKNRPLQMLSIKLADKASVISKYSYGEITG